MADKAEELAREIALRYTSPEEPNYEDRVRSIAALVREHLGERERLLEKARIKLLQHLTPSPKGHFRRAKPEDVDWYMEFEREVKALPAPPKEGER